MSKKEKLEKATKEQVAQALTKPVDTQTLIYCGPTIRNGQLQQYAIFRGKLPQHVMKHVEAEIAVKELLVPIKELSKVKNNIQKKGSRENLLFERALIYAKGGKK